MPKMGTIDVPARPIRPDITNKYPIITRTLSDALPTRLVNLRRGEGELDETVWLVEFTDRNRLPLDFFLPENDGEYDNFGYDYTARQRTKEIRQLVNYYLGRRPELQYRLEELQTPAF